MYFPKWFSGGGDLNYLDNMVKLLELRIAAELDGLEKVAKELEALERFFTDSIKPMRFDRDPSNAVVRNELQFEEICAAMEENGVDVSGLTVFGFYTRIAHFEKRNEKLKSKQNGDQQQ